MPMGNWNRTGLHSSIILANQPKCNGIPIPLNLGITYFYRRLRRRRLLLLFPLGCS